MADYEVDDEGSLVLTRYRACFMNGIYGCQADEGDQPRLQQEHGLHPDMTSVVGDIPDSMEEIFRRLATIPETAIRTTEDPSVFEAFPATMLTAFSIEGASRPRTCPPGPLPRGSVRIPRQA